MNKTQYAKHIRTFNSKDYFHGGTLSGYTDYSWEGVSPAIKTYADYILKFFPFTKTILDVGGAKGYLVKELLDRGYDAYGYDISHWAVEEGIKEFPQLKTRFKQGDILDLKQTRKIYDLVIASEILEHIPEASTYLALQNLACLSNKYVLFNVPFEIEHSNADHTEINLHPREWWDEQIKDFFEYKTHDNLFQVCWNFFPLIKKSI